MLSIIEMGFYISLAVMLCLLFLLINHLKSRIIILENQNEGMMDVMKMVRSNLFNSEKEQKQIKESVQALAKNVAYVNSILKSIPEKNNIVLEIEDLSFQRDKSTPTNPTTWEEETSDDDDEEEETTEDDVENQEAEVVNIEWPTREEIEIHKLMTEEGNETHDSEIQKRFLEMAHVHMSSSPMFIHSIDASEIQKMYFMMSMGNHLPHTDSRIEIVEEEQTGLGMEPREYEILPTANDDPVVEQLPVQDEDIISEGLPETPMPELIDEEGNVIHLTHTFSSEEIEDLNAQINEMISEVTAEPSSQSVPEPELEPEAEPKLEAIKEEKPEKQVDFSKMDVRTLRSLVLAEGKTTSERISKMKKAELIRLLTSSSSS